MRFGHVDRAIAKAGSGTKIIVEDVEVCARDFQEELLFKRDFVWDHGAHVIAARASHRGETDAGIARCGFDEAALRVDFALLFHFAEQGPGGPVLDGSEGILPFKFGEQLEVRNRIHPVDAHHGRRVLLAGEHLKNIVVNAFLVVHVRKRTIKGRNRPNCTQNFRRNPVLRFLQRRLDSASCLELP
jgi:hypothetical protein